MSPRRATRAPPRPAIVCLRVVLVCFGLGAIIWGAYLLPVFWNQATLGSAVVQIQGGQSFRPEALNALAVSAGQPDERPFCIPVLLRDAAIIKIRESEVAIASGERNVIDLRLEAAQAAVRRSLQCAPADPFLWFAEFWLENNISGLRPRNFDLLRMSYRLGPNEGWIMLKRNRYAAALYPQLPADLRESAAHEFVRLLNSDFVTDAAQIFLGPGAAMREVILGRMGEVSLARREFFVKLLRGQGYEGTIPGVEERRPR